LGFWKKAESSLTENQSCVTIKKIQKEKSCMFKKIIKISLFLCFFAALIVNLIKSHQEISTLYKKYGSGASQFLGHKFSGLTPFLENSQRIGYLTDLSLDDRIAAAEFAQAQYVLAPIILEFGNPNLKFVLVNGSSLNRSLQLVKDQQLQALKKNTFNILLTHNPKVP